MPFIKYIPYGIKQPLDVWTTCNREIQIWQELTMLRHLTGPSAIYARETTSSYIDQAKVYFLDAAKSNWRTAGLLYYYSFLNLAKAHLITNRAASGSKLKSTNIYHGLTAGPQKPSNIINYKIEIHPPGLKQSRNIFSNFYQKLLKETWPFSEIISIKISDIISYCDDISHEVSNFYNINRETIEIQSMLRYNNTDLWFEMLVHNSKTSICSRDIKKHINEIVTSKEIDIIDRSDWLNAYNITSTYFQNYSLVKLNPIKHNGVNTNQKLEILIKNLPNQFKGHILPSQINNFDPFQAWYFIPNIELNGKKMKWHPLLSNYLFAFMLSSVLRYQPHLFPPNSKDAFIAEAWCNQATSSSLRYFLMELSKQNLRLN